MFAGGQIFEREVAEMPTYKQLSADLKAREADVAELWEGSSIFAQSLKQNEGKERWVFYEGPPTANGKPHFGHLMPRVYKDLFPRYKMMKGFEVRPKGGWDTHGLPVELEVEKALGLNSKKEIEEYGVEEFIAKCKESVWLYKEEWEKLIGRMGFWIDLENAYITYEDYYIESNWWVLNRIFEQDLLYKGHRVSPYCPRCGTPLSSHEVAQGYEEVRDPSVFAKFKLEGKDNEYVIAWTTTPWTLPGNVALAVGKKFDYVKVQQEGEFYYLAEALAEKVLGEDYEILERVKGADMDGWKYEPLYPFLKNALAEQGDENPNAWFVVATEDMVTLEDGSGVVHTAVMYGEEDYKLGMEHGMPAHHTVDDAGKFIEAVTPWAGRFVKDCDREILKDLKTSGKLYKAEDYLHNYPFCWRCKTPLLYYAMDSYFVKSTGRQQEIIDNNQAIQWHPEHMKDGRFGNFLETMKDWALSRARYWGTPLNIWCNADGEPVLSVASREELVKYAKDKELAQSVELHRPYIDDVVLLHPDTGEELNRVPYVIDGWFDSGVMHTAQWHYPFERQDDFYDVEFPADFICEGLDQTRGWFYSLLVTSTLVHGDRPYPHPYKHCLVTGLGLDAEGKKMSKSWGNVLDPWEMINAYGADATRWFFYSDSAPWRDKMLSAEVVGGAPFQFLETVRNTYNFFALYADIDGFDPATQNVPVEQRPMMDRWVLSRLQGTIETLTHGMDNYDVIIATKALTSFVDDLSNWYVRTSRSRFWGDTMTDDKTSAYQTLHQALLTLSKLLGPFVPFLAESVYQALDGEKESVHLSDYPTPDAALRDEALEAQMALTRQVIVLGRAARNHAKVKTRQPLSLLKVKYPGDSGLPDELEALAYNELNVKLIEYVDNVDEYLVAAAEADRAQLGPKFGALTAKIYEAIQGSDADEVSHTLKEHGVLHLNIGGEEISLSRDDVKITYKAKDGFSAAYDDTACAVFDLTITDDLRREGYARELIRTVQELRKKADFQVSDRITLYVQSDDAIGTAIEAFSDKIRTEVLANELHLGAVPDSVEFQAEQKVNDIQATIGLTRQQP
jgi:isoleucyl-tRNA synthetase